MPSPNHRHVRNGEIGSFLTSLQLSDILGVSLRKLERDRQNGTGIPFVKYGRRILYRRADVEAFLEGSRFTCTAEARRAMEVR